MKIAVLDDEEIVRVTIEDDLRDAGHHVVSYGHPDDFLASLEKESYDVVISDIMMPKMDGLDVLRHVKRVANDTIVIMMTAYGSVASAVEAMKHGAHDYLTKPFDSEELLIRLEKIADFRDIANENRRLREDIDFKYDLKALIGQSLPVQEVHKNIQTVINSNTTVLITGETGTGKELAANIIHHNSSRKHRPFIKVSCAILAREIFESELFGHERGAFTGAIKDKQGKFELADGGSIYLDDIDDVPLDLQVKLLRVLEEREIERVGGSKIIKIDVRVIASTKTNLKHLVEQGKFREDLYYRLNVFPIALRSLRERSEDIPALLRHFLDRNKTMAGDYSIELSVLEILKKYSWKGNIRELRNLAERLALTCSDGSIKVSDLPNEFLHPDVSSQGSLSENKPLDVLMSDIERETIRRALAANKGNKTKTAELLGIPHSTLRAKMEKLGLE